MKGDHKIILLIIERDHNNLSRVIKHNWIVSILFDPVILSIVILIILNNNLRYFNMPQKDILKYMLSNL
jgi:hypothetical protein